MVGVDWWGRVWDNNPPPPPPPPPSRTTGRTSGEVARLLPGGVTDVWWQLVPEPDQVAMPSSVPDGVHRTPTPSYPLMYEVCAEAIPSGHYGGSPWVV